MKRLGLLALLLALLTVPALADEPLPAAAHRALTASREALAHNDLAAAAAPLEAYLQAHAEDAHGLAWFALGNIRHHQQRPQEALAAFTEAAARLPARADLQRNLGLSAYSLERFDAASAAFDAGWALDPLDGELRYLAAAARYRAGDAAGASERLHQLLAQQPDGALDWLELLATVETARQQPARVRPLVAARLRRAPAEPRLWELQHRLALAAGDLPAALAALEFLVRLRPEDEAGRQRLTGLYAQLGLPLAAARRLPAASEPEQRARWLEAAAHWQAAEALWRQQLALAASADGHLALGRLLYRQGRWQEARQQLLAASALAPELAEAALLAGQCALEQDQPALALEDFGRAAADPRHGPYARSMTQLLRALLAPEKKL